MDASEIDVSFHEPWLVVMANIDNVCVVAELTQEYNFIKFVEGRVMLFRYGRGMAERDEGPRFAEFTATGQLVE